LSFKLKRSGGALLGATLAVMLAAVMLALSPAVAEAQTEDKNTSSVVVRPGDSLWSISEEWLGPNATPQQIYNKTARIYALNSERIGEDPNLIYPGEVLLLKPALEPVDAPAVAGRPGRGARPAVSERASKKVAAPEPSRETAHRTSRNVSPDLAREPSDAPTHQLPELAHPPIPKPVAEPVPKAASDEVRWLPQGRLLLAALVGTATVWGAMGLILVVAALVARKLPAKRTIRLDAKELRGLALIVLLAACAYATMVLVDAHERFDRWASSYEKWQVDELLIVLSFVAMTAFVFAWRRWRETDAELVGRKALHRKLEHRATHDALTDLPNRAMFMDRLQHATERAKRERTMLAVLFIDLDGFKAVNDAFGHAGGDQLLKQAAGRLRRCARSADTVSRIGGDEFVVLLEGVKDVHQEVVTVVRRIAESLVAPYVLERGEVSVGSSIGVAFNGIEMRAGEDLLREADNAMYQAKGRTKHATRSAAQSVGPRTNGTSSFYFVPYSPSRVEGGFSEVRIQNVE
jgi:diguanylate cyclase (GGDEF)-like protein